MTTTNETGRRSGFDPAEAAAEAVREGGDVLATVLGQYGGYLSACWENLEGAGIFESERAREACDATVTWLKAAIAVAVGDRPQMEATTMLALQALGRLPKGRCSGHTGTSWTPHLYEDGLAATLTLCEPETAAGGLG